MNFGGLLLRRIRSGDMNALIIGAGGIAHHHLNSLRSLGVEVLGIYDVDGERAAKLAAEYGTAAVTDVDRALEGADTVFLLTPPSTRLSYMKRICGKCKAVFAEKPLAVTVEDAKEMERLAEENGMLCMVGFTQRFRRGFALLKEKLDDGTLGEVVQTLSVRIGPGPGSNGKLEESWRTDRRFVCGMSIESLSHDLDFHQALGGRIRKIKGQVKGTVSQLPQFDNNSDAVLQFESGAIGCIACSWSSAIAYTMKGVIGTKGAAFLRGDDIWDNTELIIQTFGKKEERIPLEDIFQEGEGYLNEDRYFFECVAKGENPEVNLTTGRRILELSHRILETSKED